MNRLIITHSSIFIPFLIVIEIFIPQAFIALKQNPAVCALSSQYVRVVAPTVLMYQYGQAYGLLCNAMGQMRVSLYITAFSSIIHWVLAFTLFDKFENKMTPIVISTAIHFVFRFLIAVVYTRTNEKAK